MARRRDQRFEHLPAVAEEYIRAVARRVGNTLRVRRDVGQELIDHFTDALAGVDAPADREQAARKLIEAFGEPKLLGALIRRAKKRCRPAWKKAIVRSMQAVAVLIGLYVLDAAYLYFGQPRISVDYVALLNEQSRPKVPDDQNAWPTYERAQELYVAPQPKVIDYINPRTGPETLDLLDQTPWSEPVRDLPPQQWEYVATWVRANEPAWKQLEQASRRKCCWFSCQAEPGAPLFTVRLPQLGNLRPLARVGAWRSAIALREGDPARAAATAATLARVAPHLQGQLILGAQLLGMSASTVSSQSIRYILSCAPLPADQLAAVQAQLSAAYPQGYPLANLEPSRYSVWDMVQRLYTDGGPGGGHLIVSRLKDLILEGGQWDHLIPVEVAAPLAGPGFNSRDGTVRKMREYHQLEDQARGLTPYQLHQTRLEEEGIAWFNSLSWRDPVLRMFAPSLWKATEMSYRSKAEYEATLTVLALKRYRLGHGQYPPGLADLVAGGYLDNVPADPYSDRPLVYRRVGDDFTLYSVGLDFQDDGGNGNGDALDSPRGYSQGRPQRRVGFDYVFWPFPPPVAAPEPIGLVTRKPSTRHAPQTTTHDAPQPTTHDAPHPAGDGATSRDAAEPAQP